MSEENSAPEESQEVSEEVLDDGSEQVQAQEINGDASDLEEVVQDALDQGASKKEVQSLIREYQLKVNGKTVTRRIDLSDEAGLKNELQLAAAARSSMQDSANLKKLYEKEVGRLKSDPWAVLKELGMDPDELAEMRIQSRIEEMKKSPEQIERESIQKELQEAREEAKKLKEERDSEQFEKMKEKAAVQIESEIESALDAHSTLPKSRHIVKRIADSMLWAMNNGFENVSADDVIPMVEKEWKEEMSRLMDDSPEEMLEQLIGQKNMERMRNKRLNAMKAGTGKTAASIKPTSASVQPVEGKPAEKMSQREFFRQFNKRK
jgi:hypothetical protein